MIKDLVAKEDNFIDYIADLNEAQQKLASKDSRCLVLLKENKPHSIFLKETLIGSIFRQTDLNMRLDLLSNKFFFSVKETDSIDYVVDMFLSFKIDFILAVDSHGNYKGMIYRQTLLRFFQFEQRVLNNHIEDVVKTPVHTISLPYPFIKIIEALHASKEEAFLIKDDKGLQGIVTYENALSYLDDLQDKNIVKARPLPYDILDSQSTLQDVLYCMYENEFKRVVVRSKEGNFYTINLDDIVNLGKSRYEVFLESKLKINNIFHDDLELACIVEVYRMGKEYVVGWMNTHAQENFRIFPGNSVYSFVPKKEWQKVLACIDKDVKVEDMFFPVDGIMRRFRVSYHKAKDKTIVKMSITIFEKEQVPPVFKDNISFDRNVFNNFLFYQDAMGIAYTKVDGTILEVNPFFESFSGYPKDELLGENYYDKFVASDDAKDAQKLQDSLFEKDSFISTVTRQVRSKDGSLIWCLMSVCAIKDAKSCERYLLIFIQDYSSLYEINQKALKQKRMLRAVFDTVEDFIFFKDTNLRYTSANQAFLDYLDIKQEKFLGKKDCDFFTKEVADRYAHDDKKVLQTKKTLKTLQEIKGKDKSIVAETVLKPYSDENGKIVGIVGAVHDVSSLVQNEKRKKLIEKVFKTASEGIVITDKDNKITAINSSFTTITGYTEEEVVGQDPSILSARAHSLEYFKKMWESIELKEKWQGEVWNKKKDGDMYLSFLVISVIKDKKGKVINHVGMFTDITELREKREKLEFLAHYDPLTSLPNRILLEESIKEAIQKEDAKIAIAFINLDDFKEINDTYGHSVGDRLLVKIGTRLQKSIQSADMVARVSGDEFIFLFQGMYDAKCAQEKIQSVYDAFKKQFIVEDKNFTFTFTMGVSLYPKDGKTTEILIRNADSAMHQAKKTKRKEYLFYDASITDALLAKVKTLEDIRRAIKNDEFVFFYQPQFDLKTDKLIGAEALVRWQHPTKGLLFPDSFMDLAEESQYIVQIGKNLAKTACRDLKTWSQKGINLDAFKIAINISAVQVAHDDVYALLKESLEAYDINSKHLEIELTETSVMNDPEQAIELFEKVKSLGLTIAIDDFGTGYSSLSYLKKFPVDKIKIDRSFIMDIPKDKDDIAITKAILSLGKNLGLRVLAEGIENEIQRDFLIFGECDEGQGYMYSKPIPMKDFEKKYLL